MPRRSATSAKYVLYWAQVNRRVAWNHGLAYAVELANQAGLPVLFYEGLTFDYPYASDRFDTVHSGRRIRHGTAN